MNDEAARQGRPATNRSPASKIAGRDDEWPDRLCLDDLNTIAADEPDEPRLCLDDFNEFPRDEAAA